MMKNIQRHYSLFSVVNFVNNKRSLAEVESADQQIGMSNDVYINHHFW